MKRLGRLWAFAAWAAALAVAFALIPRYLTRLPPGVKLVRSGVNGKSYEVRDLPGSQEAADRLAQLERSLRRMVRRARDRWPGDPRLLNIKARWNGTLREARPGNDIAYSIGKDAVYVCVRDADGLVDDLNTCTFVLLHELAHVATDKWGHPPEFWKNMRYLLEVAEQTGYYSYQSFEKEHVTYCGRPIASSPLTCVKDGSCPSALGV
jgi:hypothetical protein